MVWYWKLNNLCNQCLKFTHVHILQLVRFCPTIRDIFSQKFTIIHKGILSKQFFGMASWLKAQLVNFQWTFSRSSYIALSCTGLPPSMLCADCPSLCSESFYARTLSNKLIHKPSILWLASWCHKNNRNLKGHTGRIGLFGLQNRLNIWLQRSCRNENEQSFKKNHQIWPILSILSQVTLTFHTQLRLCAKIPSYAYVPIYSYI